MDDQRIKQAVFALLERSVDAHELARALGSVGTPDAAPVTAEAARPRTHKLLSRIVLGDILDDAILSAKPADRTFPLRLFFGELGTLLASDEDDDGDKVHVAESAFTLASGLNFFFRAEMESEALVRVGLEASRAFYALAHVAKMDPELVTKAAPLLAQLMSAQLERIKLESVDHVKVFDSQIHERAPSSDMTGSRVLRPASFLARVTTNNAVKAKAQVVT